MNGKASLTLMEQLIMLLVFALTAALCLSFFAESRRIARETARLEDATLLAQNAAALLQSGGDPESLDTGELTLTVEPLSSPVEGYLQMAAVVVSYEDERLFRLETGWQEVPS